MIPAKEINFVLYLPLFFSLYYNYYNLYYKFLFMSL